MQDLINLTYNLDCYEFFPDVRTEEEYGRWLVDHRQEFRLSEKARLYFDYESYGEDTCINGGGDFSELGYIYNNRTRFQKVYDGQHVPEKYKVFRYPLQAKVRPVRQGTGQPFSAAWSLTAASRAGMAASVVRSSSAGWARRTSVPLPRSRWISIKRNTTTRKSCWGSMRENLSC